MVCLERRTVDSCGNSTCLKTPQSGFLEEAEAVPAESNGPQRKTNPHIRRGCIDFVSKTSPLFDGASNSSPNLLENILVRCRLPLVLAESSRTDEQTEYNYFYSHYHTAGT